MPEPFKNAFNKNLISTMADAIQQVWPAFNKTDFISMSLKDLETLELKQRSQQITAALTKALPSDFEQAARILVDSLNAHYDQDGSNSQPGMAGWGVMPIADYIGQQGLEHFELGMDALKDITKHFSSEFGIRYFILHGPEWALSIMTTWTSSPDHHIRRLVSEGTRPRLPWAMQLPVFIENPQPLIPLLEALKDDGEEYVRRSVANNLNDIAKDHPDLVADIAEQWLIDASTERKKLVKHACRTLLKSGHPKVLRIFGYGQPLLKGISIEMHTPEVRLGASVEFTLCLGSASKQNQPLMIDYIVHHQKSNGQTSPKVFKWKTVTLKKGGQLVATKKHTIKRITTRKYYSGKHSIEIMVNGVSVGKDEFILSVEDL